MLRDLDDSKPRRALDGCVRVAREWGRVLNFYSVCDKQIETQETLAPLELYPPFVLGR